MLLIVFLMENNYLKVMAYKRGFVMKEKIAIIVSVLIMIVSIFFYSLIENNDDFAPYECKEYNKDYELGTDVYDLSKIKNELTNIAQEYEKGLKLTFIQYDIKENSKTAIFQFYIDDYNGKNKSCLLTMNIDIDKNKMTKIKYEKGNGKRVTGYSNEINSLEKISDYINLNENIKIIVTGEDVTLYKDGQKIEKNDFVKNITSNINEYVYNGNGVVTEVNDSNIIFENQSNNKKYSIDINSDLKFVNGRTNEEININEIKVGYYIDTRTQEQNVISVLSNIKGEELRKELIKNFTLENPIYLTVSPVGTNMKIINKNKAILTITYGDLLSDYNTDGGEFEMKVEINSNTKIECKGGINNIEQLGDVSLDIIKIRLDKNTINNEIPVATYFMSSNGD